MNIRLLAACLLFFLTCITSAFAAEDRRVALVIGNSAYDSVAKLPNPVNDATAMGAALSRLGFDVTLLTDVGKVAFDQGLADFSEKASGADLALVFYAGHGIEMGGVNYLIPVDAKLKTDLRVQFETVSLNSVLDAVSAAKKLRMVLLDACRNNPFAEKMTRSLGAKRKIGRGLTDVAAGPNELISYAAFAGKEASDGDSDHSPYTEALLANIERPGIEIGKLFRIVADEVQVKTNGEQVPYESARLPGTDIFLKEPVEDASIEKEAIEKKPTEAVEVKEIEEDWLQAKKSGDADMLKAFIDVHGANKMYRLLAERQLALLAKPGQPLSSDNHDADDAQRQAVIAALPALPKQLEALVQDRAAAPAPETECDRLAASSGDRQKLKTVKGVTYAALDIAVAKPACEAAVRDYPGDPRLMYQLARIYSKDKNPAEAMRLFRIAADKGYADAANGVAVMYWNDRSAEENRAEAMKWFTRAAEEGSIGAMLNLSAIVVKTEPQKALEWLRKGADQGSHESMFIIGTVYRDGRGVGVDPNEAVIWFRKAYAAGNSDAGVEAAKILVKAPFNAGQLTEMAEMVITSLHRGSKTAYGNVTSGMLDWPIEFRLAFQQRLADGGRYAGKVDGIIGGDTKKAIDTFFAKSKAFD
jgi:uncharacterized protein